MSRIQPIEADLSIPSLKGFLKLAEKHDLTVRIDAVSFHVAETFYLSKSREHAVGALKDPGFDSTSTVVIATNMFDFAVEATWIGKSFKGALVGGQRSGHQPAKLFQQITQLTKEIDRCLN